MDVQLSELIERIKNDGVKSAEESRSRIIEEAEKRAIAIVEKAKKDAEDLRRKAKVDAENMEQRGCESLSQAGRDLILSLKSEIEAIFNEILSQKIEENLSKEDFLADSIGAILNSWREENVVVDVPEPLVDGVTKILINEFEKKLSDGITITPVKDLEAGFRISTKEGRAFYDFSADEMTSILVSKLSPKLAELLIGKNG